MNFEIKTTLEITFIWKYFNNTNKINLLVFFVFLSITMNSQTDDLIIHTGNITKDKTIENSFTKLTTTNDSGLNWNSKGDSISIVLDSLEESESIIFNSFNFDNIDIEKINMIKCTLFGYSKGDGELTDIVLRLKKSNEYLSKNMANKVLKGVKWNKSSFNNKWVYYLYFDPIEISKVQNEDFGIELKIKNKSKNKIEAVLFDVKLEIEYTPLSLFCKDELLTFHVKYLGPDFMYYWKTPKGSYITSENKNKSIINLLFLDDDFGFKDISVISTNGIDTISGKKSFFYRDCRVSDISGVLYKDLDCNNSVDTNDVYIDSAIVELVENNGSINSAKTDIHGGFKFDNILSGTYKLRFKVDSSLIINRFSTHYDISKLDFKDGYFETDYFFLEPNFSFDSILLSCIENKSLIYNIWDDRNGNNVLDVDEKGINNIKSIFLKNEDGVIFSFDLNDKGNYENTHLSEGNYDLCIELNENHKFIESDSNIKCNSLSISCFDSAIILSDKVYKDGKIEGRVWVDKNENGIKEVNEELIRNIKFNLLDTFNNLLSTTYSDSIGAYGFLNLRPSTYKVKSIIPQEYELTSFDIGNEDINSDFQNLTIGFYTNNIEIKSGEEVKNIDCGIKSKKCSVGNFVWYDENKNGIQDLNEEGIDSVLIKLINETGKEVSSIYSKLKFNKKGFYQFTKIPFGKYKIKIEIPNRYKVTSNIQINDSINNDIVYGTNSTEEFTLLPGDKKNDLDIGLVDALGSLENFTWFDKDMNGLQSANETGVGDILFKLYNESNDSLGSKLSYDSGNELGICKFNDLEKGKYYLIIDGIVDKFKITKNHIGSNVDIDSDFTIDNNKIKSEPFEIYPGMTNSSIDLGLVLNLSSISGYVWDDTNKNGVFDTDESKLNGIKVELYLADSMKLKHFEYSGNIVGKGNFLFNDLEKGDYYLKFIIPQDYILTSGNGESMKISGKYGIGTTDLIKLGWGENIENISGGFEYKNGKVGDYIWFDENENGLQDSDEKGIGGVKVSLFDDNNNVVKTVITNLEGNYQFTDVSVGDYYVVFDINSRYKITKYNLSSSIGSKAKLDGDRIVTEYFRVEHSSQISNVDAGFVNNYSGIGSLIWYDENSNGTFDSFEKGLDNIKVELYNEYGTKLDSIFTDENGIYMFENLLFGNYYLKIDIPTEFEYSSNSSKILITNKNGLNTTDRFNLSPGTLLNSMNFGLHDKKAILGDKIWLDENENGIYEIGERGLNGIKVLLFNSNRELLDESISSNVAGSDGIYSFDVYKGTYFLKFDLDTKFQPTKEFVGSNSNIDSDLTSLNGENSTPTFSVKNGEILNSIDAGVIYEKASVGGVLWKDSNADGIIQKEEKGLNGFLVKLFDENDNLVDSTHTYKSNIGNGFYIFKELSPSDYYIKFIYPDSFSVTQYMIGSNPKINSKINDFDKNGSTARFHLSPGENNLQINGGIYVKPINFIGDFIWLDKNKNGIQDADEDGLNNYKVELFSSDGNLISSTISENNPISNKSGFYSFENIPIGDYYLRFSVKIGYLFTKSLNNLENDLNSDVSSINGFGTTGIFHVNNSEVIDYLDAGIRIDNHSSIGNFVWEDMNGDGVQNEGEPGLNDVIIKLYKDGNKLVETTKSSFNIEKGDGFYIFDNLVSGNYYIKVIIPNNYLLTEQQNAGNDKSIDSDINERNGPNTTDIIHVGVEQRVVNIDIGLVRFASVGDFVWGDSNANGMQDAFEKGLEDITIELYDIYRNIWQSINSNDIGYYEFKRLFPGEYYIKVKSLRNSLFTIPERGDNKHDSDINYDNGVGTSSTILLKSGENNRDVDVGILKDGITNLKTFPNPVFNLVKLSFINTKGSKATFIVSDIRGNKIKSHDFNIAPGLNTYSIDLKEYKSGIYNVLLLIDDVVKERKYILKSE